MVTIISLKATNFRRLNFREPLSFPRGLTIIRGRNEAGKSTILEAILFGLYGDYRVLRELRGGRQSSLVDVINYSSSRAKVEVTFEVEGRRFRVERIIERSRDVARQVDARLFEVTGSGERLIATGTRRVNEEVQRLINVDWREMLASNIIAQKDLERLIRLNKGERDKIINMFMGLESYNKAIEELQEEKRSKSSELEKKETEAKMLSERLESLLRLEEDVKKWTRELQEIEQVLPRLEEEEKKLDGTVQYFEELYKRLQARRSLLEKKRILEENIKRAEKELQETRQRIETIRFELSKNEEKLAKLDIEKKRLEQTLVQAEKENTELQSLLARVDELWRSLEESKKEHGRIGEELSRLSQRLQGIEKISSSLGVLGEELKKIEEKTKKVKIPAPYIYSSIGLVALGATLSILYLPLGILALLLSIVPILLGKLSKQKTLLGLQSEKEKLLREKNTLEGELRLLERDREEYGKLLERKTEIEEKISQILGQLQTLSRAEGQASLEHYVLQLREKAREQQKRTEELRRRHQETLSEFSSTSQNKQNLAKLLEELSSREKERDGEIGGLREQLKTVEAQYSSISIPVPPFEIEGVSTSITEDELEDIEVLLQVYRREHGSKSREVASKKADKNRLKQYIEQAEEQLKELPRVKENLDTLGKEIKSLKTEIEAREKAIEVLRNISAKRRSMFAPSVEQNMNWLISYVTGGRYKAVRINPDNYDVEVYDAEAGKWMRRDIYSGGTNDQFLLAMRIAFTLSLLPSAKGTYPRFLFLDEPLGSSDQERRQQIVRLLANELTRVFDQIFLVTHVEIEEPPNTTLIELADGRIAETREIKNQEEA